MMYGGVLIALQGVGLVASVWFLATHRPKQWRRLQALDAMGFPVIVALVFARGLILTVSSWPVASRPWPHMAFSLLTLLLVDIWVIVKLVNFRRFMRGDSDSSGM